MKYIISEEPPIPKEVTSPDTIAYYIAKSLDLIPERGKGDVAIEMLKLFAQISSIREGYIEEKGKKFYVKNGMMKAKDIREYLEAKGKRISQSQFYRTYLERFIERGLLRKQGVYYGLKAPTLALTLGEVRRGVMYLLDRLEEHAQRLGRYV